MDDIDKTDPSPGGPSSWPDRVEVMQTVLDASTDPIFNILEDGTYRYVNAAFSGPFGKTPEQVIGRRIWDLFEPGEAEKRMSVVRRAFSTRETIVFEVRVPTPAEITDRKQVELERERLIAELQEALAKVRTLSGLLPICAHCSKIRDDRGHWTRVESYVSAHSQAKFSHGICPDCLRREYPEVGR